MPALHLSRTQVRALIETGGRGGASGRGEHRVFGALVIAEVGLAVVLVSRAGLLIRSYNNSSVVRARSTSCAYDIRSR